MVRHIFRDYLLFEDQYEHVRAFWKDLVENEARRSAQDGEWQPWIPRTFFDGTPIPVDTGPICDARSVDAKRALRILQGPPESNDVEIAAWLTSFNYTDSGGPGPTDELIINLSLSEESAAIARTLIASWMDKRISLAEMELILREALRHISA